MANDFDEVCSSHMGYDSSILALIFAARTIRVETLMMPLIAYNLIHSINFWAKYHQR
jgi:aspartate ammonia-lyase